MRKLLFLPLILSAVLLGCATYKTVNHPNNEAYKMGVENAFSEMAEMDRRPAQEVADLKSNFRKLQEQVSYIVFPKRTNMTEKHAVPVRSLFWTPKQINVRAQRLVTCKDLKKQTIGGMRNKEFFKNAPDDKMCAVLSYTFADRPNFSVLAKDDIIEARIYIDSDYRGYGIDYVKYVNRRTNRTVSTALDPNFPINSGLTFIPTDIPVLTGLAMERQSAIGPAYDEHGFITRQMEKIGAKNSCGGAVTYTYRETFGSRVNGGWCDGDPLPSKIETARFVAFIRKNK